MEIQIITVVELLNFQDEKEIYLFGQDHNTAVYFLDKKIKKPEYKEGFIKLTIKKGNKQ